MNRNDNQEIGFIDYLENDTIITIICYYVD